METCTPILYYQKVKVCTFDCCVAEKQFAGILTSNREVDVGRGDFSSGRRFAT